MTNDETQIDLISQEDATRYRGHSIEFNRLAWKLAEAVGDAGPDDDKVWGDPFEQLARLVAQRDDARQARSSE